MSHRNRQTIRFGFTKANSSSATRGFTLIELLVVIAIISVLATILLPSLQQASKLSKSAACINNQRNTLQVINMYTLDYNGRLFTYVWGPGGDMPWTKKLYQCGFAEEKTEFFRCPSVPAVGITVDWMWYYQTYGLRYEGPSFEQVLINGYYWTIFDSLEVQQPSEYCLTADSASPVTLRQLFTWQYGHYDWLRSDGMVHLRHLDKTNMAFADGHVENLLGTDRIRSVMQIDPNINGKPLRVLSAEGEKIRID